MKHFKLLNMQHKESCGLVMHAVFEGWGVIVLESRELSSLDSAVRTKPTSVITPVPPTQAPPGATGNIEARQTGMLRSRGV